MTKLDHINMTAASLDESINWYSNLFGFKLVETGLSQAGKRWAILTSGDSAICMSEHTDRQRADSFDDHVHHKVFHFGLRVTDEAAWREKVLRYKLRVHYGGPVEYPHSTSWYVNDPSGHEIEVSYAGGAPMKFGS